MSAITGQSVSDLVTLRKAFKEAGLSPGSLQHNLVLLQKSLGGVNEEGLPTAFAFRQIGLSIDSLKDLSATDQINQIGGAISKLPTQAERTAKAMEIFGRGGAEMLVLFSNPKAIEEAKANVGGYAAIMERNAGLFTKITNTLEALSMKVKGFFIGFADKVGPSLLPLLEKLITIQLNRDWTADRNHCCQARDCLSERGSWLDCRTEPEDWTW